MVLPPPLALSRHVALGKGNGKRVLGRLGTSTRLAATVLMHASTGDAAAHGGKQLLVGLQRVTILQ
eukprot:8441626-Lingulodinium_polyedra.AAC.1